MYKRVAAHLSRHWQKHLMMLPCVVLLIIFNYVPMAGIVIGFEDYLPNFGFFGSQWVGIKWFRFMFGMNNFGQVIRNTLFISLLKIFTAQAASILFALLLNELRSRKLKNAIQNGAIFPYFVSWVVCAGILKDIVAQEGIINTLLNGLFGIQISFLTNPGWFTVLIAVSNIWKDAGYNAIILAAALSAIDPALYEAAEIDGANRLDKMVHVTLPGISRMVAMLVILALGGVMNGGFDQIYNLYNSTVSSTSEIIDTYVYRMGINAGMYSLGAAVGVFKSVVGAVLLMMSHYMAKKYAGYRIF